MEKSTGLKELFISAAIVLTIASLFVGQVVEIKGLGENAIQGLGVSIIFVALPIVIFILIFRPKNSNDDENEETK